MKNKVRSVSFVLNSSGRTIVKIRRECSLNYTGKQRIYTPTLDQINAIKYYCLNYGIVRPEPTITENKITLYYALWSVVRK